MNKLPSEGIKRELIRLKKGETSKKHGCYPDKRPAEELIELGIVVVNKVSGPTSHLVNSLDILLNSPPPTILITSLSTSLLSSHRPIRRAGISSLAVVGI